MGKISQYLYKDKVFVIALVLALASMILNPPSLDYFSYINLKVIAIMFTLMFAVAGLYETHFFDFIATKLVIMFKRISLITLIILWTTFFLAMLLTNDAVLLTLVPFAIFILKHANQEKNLISLLILMTFAANMGSALTPMGDPQNIYLYAFYNIPFKTFIQAMLPITFMGFVLITLFNFIFISNEPCKLNIVAPEVKHHKIALYVLLLINGILCVIHVIPEEVTFIITIVVGFFTAKHLFRRVDYPLLLTFVCFFIFTANISQSSDLMAFFHRLLESPLNVYFSGLLTSQLISNVPAAVLLSTFTKPTYWKSLLYGVNIGAMGTIIGSLASLITFKYVMNQYPLFIKKYLIRYTLLSLLMIGMMTLIVFFFLL
jgi:Na+/H+ antiporter NhaD/arsenite permease-like protein